MLNNVAARLSRGQVKEKTKNERPAAARREACPVLGNLSTNERPELRSCLPLFLSHCDDDVKLENVGSLFVFVHATDCI